MNEWKNLDELKSFQTLKNESQPVDLTKVMAGEAGAGRVAAYQVPMAAGLIYSYAAKQVDDGVLKGLKALAEEAQLAGKFEELYNGAVINTGEKRLVLHQLTRGQLGNGRLQCFQFLALRVLSSLLFNFLRHIFLLF